MDRKTSRPRWLGEDRRGWDHVRVHVQLIEDERVGAHAMAVYLGLAKHAELESGQTFVGIETLAGYTKLSYRSVHTALKHLAELKYVEKVSRCGRTSLYRLPPPPPLHDVQGSGENTSAAGSGPVLHVVQDTPAPDADERDPLDDSQGTKVDPLASPSARRESDASLWAALLAACGLANQMLTKPRRASLNAALKAIKETGEATPEEITRRAGAYRREHPDWHFTEHALAKYWPDFPPGSDPVAGEEPIRSGRLTEVKR